LIAAEAFEDELASFLMSNVTECLDFGFLTSLEVYSALGSSAAARKKIKSAILIISDA